MDHLSILAMVTTIGNSNPEAALGVLKKINPRLFKSPLEGEIEPEGVEWVDPSSIEEYEDIIRKFESLNIEGDSEDPSNEF